MIVLCQKCVCPPLSEISSCHPSPKSPSPRSPSGWWSNNFLSPVRDSLGSGESRTRSRTTFFARVRCGWHFFFLKRKRERERGGERIHDFWFASLAPRYTIISSNFHFNTSFFAWPLLVFLPTMQVACRSLFGQAGHWIMILLIMCNNCYITI